MPVEAGTASLQVEVHFTHTVTHKSTLQVQLELSVKLKPPPSGGRHRSFTSSMFKLLLGSLSTGPGTDSSLTASASAQARALTGRLPGRADLPVGDSVRVTGICQCSLRLPVPVSVMPGIATGSLRLSLPVPLSLRLSATVTVNVTASGTASGTATASGSASGSASAACARAEPGPQWPLPGLPGPSLARREAAVSLPVAASGRAAAGTGHLAAAINDSDHPERRGLGLDNLLTQSQCQCEHPTLV